MFSAGHEKVVELLLRKGAKFNAKITKSENTPLHLAAQNGISVLRYVLNKKENTYCMHLNQQMYKLHNQRIYFNEMR